MATPSVLYLHDIGSFVVDIVSIGEVYSYCFTGLLATQLYQDKDDAILIEMKTDTVIILSSLCEQDLHRKVCIVYAITLHQCQVL